MTGVTARASLVAIALVATIAVVVAACSGPSASVTPPPESASANVGPTGSASPVGSAEPSSAAPASPSASAVVPSPSLASPVTGVVVSVDSAGLSQVKGFKLRMADGSVQPFAIGTLENGTEFPPGHLMEHVVSADPVRVYFRPDGGALVVYRIEDAG